MVTDETDKLAQSDALPREHQDPRKWASRGVWNVAEEGGMRIDEKLRALAQSDAEPVAWLVRVHGERGMNFATVDKPSAYLYAEKHPNYSVEPLFTALPSTADALKNENRRSSTQTPKRLPARR